MKALILAAGFGTRLAPYSKTLPKPLFTINQRPVLDHAINKLIFCGCDKIYINIHHCHGRIQDFVLAHPLKEKLETVYEPVILDTGGAMANLSHRLGPDPFIVVNADIVSSIDITAVYKAHLASDLTATLVLHDYPQFNKISVDAQGLIRSFDSPCQSALAFTGIQVISPAIFESMPEKSVFSSIEVYKNLAKKGRVKAHIPSYSYWRDIGTICSYKKTSRQCLSREVFGLDPRFTDRINISPLSGDGSDRKWFRASFEDQNLILSDHDICPENSENLAQLSALVSIGNHLTCKKICVPKIFGHDSLSGQVAMEDLGDTHLFDLVSQIKNQNPKGSKLESELFNLYQPVVDRLIEFSQKGIRDFNPDWTCQTRTYSKSLILEKECAYFITAFAKGYLNLKLSYETFGHEFDYIADSALANGFSGLMHRDMQSKNIMVKNGEIFFIDFQSARKGPVQYDLASLLIDPYVTLPEQVQKALLDYALERLKIKSYSEKADFLYSYLFCCLTRNLQALGAFGFLTRVKGKKGFESHIPAALLSLKTILDRINKDNPGRLSKLTNFVRSL